MDPSGYDMIDSWGVQISICLECRCRSIMGMQMILKSFEAGSIPDCIEIFINQTVYKNSL